MSIVTTVSIPRKKAYLVEEAKQISNKSMSKLFTEFLEFYVAHGGGAMIYIDFIIYQTEEEISEINRGMDVDKEKKKVLRQRIRDLENKKKDMSMEKKECEAEKEIFEQMVEVEALQIFEDYHGQKTMESCRKRAEKVVEEKMKMKGRVD